MYKSVCVVYKQCMCRSYLVRYCVFMLYACLVYIRHTLYHTSYLYLYFQTILQNTLYYTIIHALYTYVQVREELIKKEKAEKLAIENAEKAEQKRIKDELKRIKMEEEKNELEAQMKAKEVSICVYCMCM